jgi:hypothetical protein
MQLSGASDVNVSQRIGNEFECSVSQNPNDPKQLFVACNTSGSGLFSARSADGGLTWSYPPNDRKVIFDNVDSSIKAACCDPSSTWDRFGNLFVAYLDQWKSRVAVVRSTDGGASFSTVKLYEGSVDQPTIVAATTSDPAAPVAVWAVWNQGFEGTGRMVAVGAPVTGLGADISFGEPQTIPGTDNCSFGDVAIARSGAVVQVCQTPTGGEGPARILVNTDPDGLGPLPFGGPRQAATTNVGGLDFIPAQNSMSVDAEAGLAFGSRPGSSGAERLYLVYTEETAPENNDLDVLLRYSDDLGATWLPETPIRVNDDDPASRKSQFLPRIAVDPRSGNISVCWYDCRNSPENTAIQLYCAASSPSASEPRFSPNAAMSDGTSASTGLGYERGDYAGLLYRDGVAHPVWVDTFGVPAQQAGVDATFEVKTDQASEAQEQQEKKTKSVLEPDGRRRHVRKGDRGQ